jgi:CheY-like chemotaxis protein
MSTLLVIDDDKDILDYYQTVLSAAGYDLVLASSAAEARSKLDATRPDLALVDIMMDKGLPGFDLAREIHTRYPGVPIFLVSSINQEFKEPLAFDPDERVPIRKFLDKPVKAEALLREVAEALAARPRG